MTKSNLVILGGGFAGTTLARRLERRRPEDWQLILLSQENCITYNPLLAEVVGASMLPGHAASPPRQPGPSLLAAPTGGGAGRATSAGSPYGHSEGYSDLLGR